MMTFDPRVSATARFFVAPGQVTNIYSLSSTAQTVFATSTGGPGGAGPGGPGGFDDVGRFYFMSTVGGTIARWQATSLTLLDHGVTSAGSAGSKYGITQCT